MNTPHPQQDFIDELLARQPIQPTDGFTDQVMAKIVAEKTLDADIDSFLAGQPVEPHAGLTERTLAALEAAAPARSRSMPNWGLLLGGMAAALVAGTLAFVAFFEQSEHLAPLQNAEGIIANAASQPEQAEWALLPDEAGDWEELLLMEAALAEAAPITERENWQTLAMLAN